MINKLKIYIICQEEPFFIPKLIKCVLENQNDIYEVVGCSNLKPHRKNKTMKDWFFERAKIYNCWELFITSLCFIYCKILYKFIGNLTGKNPYSVRDTFKRYNIKEIYAKDINNRQFVNKLRDLNIDVIISVSPPQIFKKDLLNASNMCCINAHGTLLPRHRGVFGSWWIVFSGDKEGGATIHSMELKLDAGEIFWQESFPIKHFEETQYSVAYKTKRLMAFGLVKVLNDIAVGNLKAIPLKYEHSYNKAPSRKLGAIFHRRGYRIIKIKDVRNILSVSYEE